MPTRAHKTQKDSDRCESYYVELWRGPFLVSNRIGKGQRSPGEKQQNVLRQENSPAEQKAALLVDRGLTGPGKQEWQATGAEVWWQTMATSEMCSGRTEGLGIIPNGP